MIDTIDDFKCMKERKKALHSSNKVGNIKTILASGIPFVETNSAETILFRQKGKPKVDFYPSTGRWRHAGKTHNGGADAFIKWYKEQ